jgi:hypothetical protein
MVGVGSNPPLRSLHLALWQFSVHLEPCWEGVACQTAQGGTDLKGRIEESHALSDQLDAWFTRLPSWSDSVITWQNENGHQVQMVLDKSTPAELTGRIDLRRPAEGIVVKLLELARRCNSQWKTDDGHTLASEGEFGNAIQNSPAARFVTDPKGFLSASTQGRPQQDAE